MFDLSITQMSWIFLGSIALCLIGVVGLFWEMFVKETPFFIDDEEEGRE